MWCFLLSSNAIFCLALNFVQGFSLRKPHEWLRDFVKLPSSKFKQTCFINTYHEVLFSSWFSNLCKKMWRPDSGSSLPQFCLWCEGVGKPNSYECPIGSEIVCVAQDLCWRFEIIFTHILDGSACCLWGTWGRMGNEAAFWDEVTVLQHSPSLLLLYIQPNSIWS